MTKRYKFWLCVNFKPPTPHTLVQMLSAGDCPPKQRDAAKFFSHAHRYGMSVGEMRRHFEIKGD